MKKPLRMSDVMTRNVHSVGRNQRLDVAHEMMRKHRVRHLPVLDAGELVGVLSQRDLYFLESLDGIELAETSVEEAMSQEVYRVTPAAKVADVARRMINGKYGCTVVVEGGKIAGIFTTIDALRTLVELIGDTPRA